MACGDRAVECAPAELRFVDGQSAGASRCGTHGVPRTTNDIDLLIAVQSRWSIEERALPHCKKDVRRVLSLRGASVIPAKRSEHGSSPREEDHAGDCLAEREPPDPPLRKVIFRMYSIRHALFRSDLLRASTDRATAARTAVVEQTNAATVEHRGRRLRVADARGSLTVARTSFLVPATPG